MVSRRIESRLDILVVAVIAHVALRKLNMHHSKCKLHQLIQEFLRLHTVLTIQRVVTSPEYTLPGTKTKMKKGSMVFINSPGIHSDPKYYPNPTVFKLDNSNKEAKVSRSL